MGCRPPTEPVGLIVTDFYEPDEPIDVVLAAYDAGIKGITRGPHVYTSRVTVHGVPWVYCARHRRWEPPRG